MGVERLQKLMNQDDAEKKQEQEERLKQVREQIQKEKELKAKDQ